MNRKLFYFAVVGIVGLSLGLYGCGTRLESEPATPGTLPAAADSHEHKSDHAHSGHGEHSHDAHSQHMDKMMAGLAKLSPEDRASAERQHICPVSGDMLGAMGPPLKIDVDGQPVWICCEACKDELLAHPEKYLAKLQDNSPPE